MISNPGWYEIPNVMRKQPAPNETPWERPFREKGLPITWQRRVVLETLAGRSDHPTADQIYAAVHAKVPGVSRTTVYRILDTLVRLGAAARVAHPGASSRFDPLTRRHHHLLCVVCGALEDLHDPGLDALPPPKRHPRGYAILDHSVYFRGICPPCRARGPQAAARPPAPEAGLENDKEGGFKP